MRIDAVQNVIMRSFEVQAAAQTSVFQGELARQSTSLRMQEEMKRSHTQVAQASEARADHEATVLDPDREPRDNPGEGQGRRHAPPLLREKAKEKGGSPGRPATGSIIDLSA